MEHFIDFKNEDCIKTMKNMIENGTKVDIVLTSPPYNTARVVKTQKAIETHINRYIDYNDNMSNEDYCKWTVSLFENFDKILQPNGVVLYNLSYSNENPEAMWLAVSDIIHNTNFMIADTIVWKKKSALPQNVSKNKLTRIVEFVFVFCRRDEYKTYNANKKITSHNPKGQAYYENVFNFIEASNNDGSCKLNKATFSSEFVVKLLEIYAKEESVIYDPFMGSGTTAIGVEKYGKKCSCIGSEISFEQVEYSKKRLNEYVEKHRSLFDF